MLRELIGLLVLLMGIYSLVWPFYRYLLTAGHAQEQLDCLFANDGKKVKPIGAVLQRREGDRLQRDLLAGVPGPEEAHGQDEQQKDPQMQTVVLYHKGGDYFLQTIIK